MQPFVTLASKEGLHAQIKTLNNYLSICYYKSLMRHAGKKISPKKLAIMFALARESAIFSGPMWELMFDFTLEKDPLPLDFFTTVVPDDLNFAKKAFEIYHSKYLHNPGPGFWLRFMVFSMFK
jgi:hypothetical protein